MVLKGTKNKEVTVPSSMEVSGLALVAREIAR
jgi:hypothetical protein